MRRFYGLPTRNGRRLQSKTCRTIREVLYCTFRDRRSRPIVRRTARRQAIARDHFTRASARSRNDLSQATPNFRRIVHVFSPKRTEVCRVASRLTCERSTAVPVATPILREHFTRPKALSELRVTRRPSDPPSFARVEPLRPERLPREKIPFGTSRPDPARNRRFP